MAPKTLLGKKYRSLFGYPFAELIDACFREEPACLASGCLASLSACVCLGSTLSDKIMQSFSNMSRADLEFIYSELNSFRWPAILPLKPEGWHDPNPFYPWPDNDGRSGLEKWRLWKETIAGKTQTAIINHIAELI